MSKRTQVVCAHLENVSRKLLEKHQDIARQYVRNRHGVYALYRGDKLHYVGLASSLGVRLAQHLKDRHRYSWDYFSVYLTIGDSQLRELESLILRIVPTPGNKQKGKLYKSNNLRRSLNRDIIAKQRRERIEICPPAVKARAETPKPLSAPKQSVGKKARLAGFISKTTKLRAQFKGKTITASVRRNGIIRLNGKTFTSPSQAAAHACHRPSCDGWTFWKFERDPGEWVILDNLRTKP